MVYGPHRMASMSEPHPKPRNAATGTAGLAAHAPRLFRYLASRLRRHQDIEDLVQYVFQRFLQSPQHEIVRQPEAYLYRIASNVINEWALHRKREIVSFDSETMDLHAEQDLASRVWTEDIADRLALEQQLQRILAQVPVHYRAVLILNVRDGLTCEEIGRELGITKQTAKKYLSRGLASCRAAQWDR